jgi:hypothetical protein
VVYEMPRKNSVALKRFTCCGGRPGRVRQLASGHSSCAECQEGRQVLCSVGALCVLYDAYGTCRALGG